MKICQLEKIAVHYEMYGQGIPVLCLHGWEPDHELMTSCLEPFFQNNPGYRRIYPDLPGMGLTKAESWIKNSDDILQVMLEFIDSTILDAPFLLIGESYGGYLARGILLNKFEQVIGLGLICPVGEIIGAKRKLPPFQPIIRELKFFNALSPEEQNNLDGFFVVQTKQILERFETDILPGVKRANTQFLNTIQKPGTYNFSFDVDTELPVYSGPSFFLLGRQDNIVGFRDQFKLLSKFSRASFVVLDAAGHNLQLEQEKILHAHLREWLDRVDYSISGKITSQFVV
jgi:pimeloyl-ACP methyl ester carboxylesterase